MFKKNSIDRLNFCWPGRDIHGHGIFSWLVPVVFMLLLSGCQTIPTLPPVNLSNPGWKVQNGQVVWRSKKDAPELTGELLVAINSDGQTFVEFTKTPLPFFVAQTTSNSWQFEVIPTHKIYSFHGRPTPRIPWLNLPACLAGAPPPKKWHWERLDNGGFRFQNLSTGESLEGYLNP